MFDYSCVFARSLMGTYYEPPEFWCELDLDCDCEDCQYSREYDDE